MRPCKFNFRHMCNIPCGTNISTPPIWCHGWRICDITKKEYKEGGYKIIADKIKIGKGGK